jgi:hypothetical protein
VKQERQQKALRTNRVIPVMDLSVAPHIPLFVASGASIWRARNVLVGSTFESWVRMSTDGLELLEATEAIFVEQQY